MEFKLDADKDGYKCLRIANKKWLIHRLVYLLFVGPLLPGLVVCHIDNNRSNNCWENLLQSTQKINISHKRLHGTHQAGETHPSARHTKNQIDAVKRALSEAARSKTGRLRKGEAIRIAQETGVSLHTIHDLSTKKGLWA